MRRNEFLALTNNPVDIEIMGLEGRAALLRQSAKQLDISDDVIPGKDEFLKRQKAKQENQQPPPEILKIQAQSEQDNNKLQANAIEFNRKMDLELQKHQERMEFDYRKEQEKLEMEKEIRMMQIDEETKRWQAIQNLERQKAATARERDLVKIREQMNVSKEKNAMDARAHEALARSSEAKETKKPEKAEPNITIIVDNKSGKITKQLTVNRGKDAKIIGAKIIETPTEESGV